MTLRVLIADDEPLSRARLKRLLGKEPDVELVAECEDGRAALEALGRAPVDLLFLDIEMPESSGFEVLELLGEPPLATVFVTAYSQHAVRAFDVSAVDYLVKPIDPQRLALAVERARARIAASGPRREFVERIPVKSGARIRFLDVSEIDCIEAQGNYVALYAGERQELVRQTMTVMTERLDPAEFVRVHRRWIVRRAHIRELEPLAGGEFVVVLRSGRKLLSGRTYRSQLVELTKL